MKTTRPSLGKYVCGMGTSLIIFLAGGWLILAPFALGYQPYGTDWVSQTTNSFILGICVAVVALVAFFLFFFSLLGSLRASGVLVAPSRVVAQAPVPYQAQAPMPQATAQSQSDLDKTLATLAAALAADLSARRQTDNNIQNDQTESMVNRSEVR
jgi:hypothetical protein